MLEECPPTGCMIRSREHVCENICREVHSRTTFFLLAEVIDEICREAREATLAKAAQGKPGLGAGGIKRVGGVGARSGPMIFRPSIAGMQPEPFLVPGAKQALLLGMPMIRNTVIMAWNL